MSPIFVVQVWMEGEHTIIKHTDDSLCFHSNSDVMKKSFNLHIQMLHLVGYIDVVNNRFLDVTRL